MSLRERHRRLGLETTSFVGRRAELADVRALLAGSRLVTLIGPGGVGKTRLAVQVARQVARNFADGVRVVDLGAVSDPELVAQTIAAELGLRDLSHQPMDKVVDFLREQSMLLVIDNCEHLAETCGMLIGKILTAASQVRVLATSRHVLGIEGEHLLAVPPLAVPPDGPAGASESAADTDAVALLVDRVAAVDSQFTLGPDNQDAVAAICRRLDGIPLAIELVAVWFRVLPPGEVLRHLGDRFGLLGRRQSTRPTRQQTLLAAVEWSYGLCSPTEQALWARLSVFRGGFTLDAASRAGLPEEETSRRGQSVLELIAGLVDKSVLQRDHDGMVARYRMLETVREYGAQRLAETEVAARVRDLHRDYFVEFAAELDALWCGPKQLEVAAATRREHANLRGALDHSFSTPDTMLTGAKLALSLHYYWLNCGFLGEGWRWMDRVLAIDELPDAMRVEALWITTYASVALGDPTTGEATGTEAVRLARRIGDDYLLGTALLGRAGAAFILHEHARADTCYTECITRLTRSGRHDSKLILGQAALAMVAAFRGDPTRAADLARQAVETARRFGEEWAKSYAIYTLALAEWQTGNLQQATDQAIHSLRIKHRFNDITGIGILVELLAWIAASAGNGQRAARILGAASQVWRHGGGKAMLNSENWLGPHRTCVDQAQHQLGERTYQAVFDEGAAASPTIDHAVHHILGTKLTPAKPPTPNDPANPLTKRELQIAKLVTSGASNKEIAAQLVISPRTVDTHVQNILEKLGFSSRIQIATWLN